MSEDFYPIDDQTRGSVPAADRIVPYGPPRARRSRLGMAVAALALVAGGTVSGIAMTHTGPGEQAPGFGTETSQAFTGGQEEPNDPEQAAPQPTTRQGEAGGESD